MLTEEQEIKALAEIIKKEREENAPCVDMTISSHVPSKWRFVDLETGDIWKWVDGHFKKGDELEFIGYRLPSAEPELTKDEIAGLQLEFAKTNQGDGMTLGEFIAHAAVEKYRRSLPPTPEALREALNLTSEEIETWLEIVHQYEDGSWGSINVASEKRRNLIIKVDKIIVDTAHQIEEARREGQEDVLTFLENDYPDEAASIRQALQGKE